MSILLATRQKVTLQHSKADGAFERKWRLDDVLHGNLTVSPMVVGRWLFLWYGTGCWIVPRDKMRLSAGVPLPNVKPYFVIPTHLGKLLLLEDLASEELQFVTLSSFVEGLCAVRRKFERELEEGRRVATTADERLCNLRKCREQMKANSKRIVQEHLKAISTNWSHSELLRKFDCPWSYAVLRLTTPDGLPVDDHDDYGETNVAVVGMQFRVQIRVKKARCIDADAISSKFPLSVSPYSHCDAGQLWVTGMTSTGICAFRYVRRSWFFFYTKNTVEDSDLTNAEGHPMSRILPMLCPLGGLLPVLKEGSASGRWCVIIASRLYVVNIYDTKTGKVAPLNTPSTPYEVIETAEGLWMVGFQYHKGLSPWAKLYKTDELLSLTDASVLDLQKVVRRRPVFDKQLDNEAFGETLNGDVQRRPERHPGHYWVVAGYGPVPTKLRAPVHIYKQLEFRRQLAEYQGYPFWSTSSFDPWMVTEGNSDFCRVFDYWIGVVDVRNDVTAESVKENPGTDAWCASIDLQPQSVQRGEFSVKGSAIRTTSSPNDLLEIPVVPGRWLWRAETDGENVELTLRHESVAEEMSTTGGVTPMPRLMDDFESHLIALSELAPLIPEEGLRVKIAEYDDSVYGQHCTQPRESFVLFDNEMAPNGTAWNGESALTRWRNKLQVVPFASGVGVLSMGMYATFTVEGEKVICVHFKEQWRS